MSDHELAREINFWGETSEEDLFNLKGIVGSKSFFTSPRGIKLFTRSWLPSSPSPPRGLIFMVHGYGNDVSWTFQSTPIFLAQMGFACFALDIEGHGRSDGVRAYVPSVDLVVEDLVSFFDSIKQNPKYQGLPRFLFGESMGGAICLLIHFADPLGFDGAVLVAPMCKISDKVRPKWPIDQFLITISRFVPTWAIVPTEDLLEKSIKVEEKKPIARRNPMRYSEKPRLGTVMELLRVTDYLGKKLKDVSIPFIVLHGSADAVTDPEVSRELYEHAKSEDKTLRIYGGMMHSMLFGEPDENIDIVRKDIVSWLNDKCGGGDDQTQAICDGNSTRSHLLQRIFFRWRFWKIWKEVFDDPYPCPLKELIDTQSRASLNSYHKLERLLKMLFWTQNQADEKSTVSTLE